MCTSTGLDFEMVLLFKELCKSFVAYCVQRIWIPERKKNVVSIFGRYQRCRHLLRESGCCVTMSNVIRIMGGCLNVDYFLFSSPFPNALTKEYSFTFMLFHSFTPIPRPNNQFWGDNVSAVAFEMLVSSFKAYSKWVFGCTRTEVVIMVPSSLTKTDYFPASNLNTKSNSLCQNCVYGVRNHQIPLSPLKFTFVHFPIH